MYDNIKVQIAKIIFGLVHVDRPHQNPGGFGHLHTEACIHRKVKITRDPKPLIYQTRSITDPLGSKVGFERTCENLYFVLNEGAAKSRYDYVLKLKAF